MKKVFGYVLLAICILMFAGCDINNSPEKVAKEMVSRLSEGDYNNIYELLYISEHFYKDEEMLLKYLENNNLDIKGNQKIEVVDSVVEETRAKVNIAIDNNLLFTANLVKINDKWLIDISDKLGGPMNIKVPVGVAVKLNGKAVDSSYTKVVESNPGWTWGDATYNVKSSIVQYTIPQSFKGEYELVIEGDNITKVETTISSGETYGKGMLMANDNIEESSCNFILEYFRAVNEALNNKSDFSVLNKYYDLDDETYKNVKEKYEEQLNLNKIEYLFKGIYNHKALGDDYRAYYVSDDTILYTLQSYTKYKYILVYNYVTESYGNKTNSVLHLAKNGDSYVIKGGTGLIPEYD